MKFTLQKTLLYCFAMLLANTMIAQPGSTGGPLGGGLNTAVICDFDVKDYPPIGKDCVYFLKLSDSAGNGWDGASIDVSVSEAWPATNYKMTTADGNCKIIPIYVNDGETIDLEYWNGANEVEHGFELCDALGVTVNDINGNPILFTSTPIAAEQIRAKSTCPSNSCTNSEEDFTVRITLGDNPIQQSWEIYEGEASTTAQGNRVIFVNATAYSGLAPGTQITYPVTLDLCNIYTFVSFDAFNDGWEGGGWELISSNVDYGNEITSPLDDLFGQSLVLESGDFADFFPLGDEDRRQFTLPCNPGCSPVNVTGAINCSADVNLTVAAPEVCYPLCDHAVCDEGITVQHFVLVNGVDYDVIEGAAAQYTGQTSIPFGNLPVGCHKYVTKYTYCDGIMVKCTSDLNIVVNANPVPACNDLVHVSLATPDQNDDNGTGGLADDLGECVIKILPDMVLEMPGNSCPGVFNEYEVTIIDGSGNPLVVYAENGLPLDCNGGFILPGSNTEPANNLVGPGQLMQTLTYVVTHKLSGNRCWGQIRVEDKAAPVIECTGYDIKCTNPNALDELYTNTVDLTAEAELPANIAGGLPGLASHTYIPINAPCLRMGEVIQNIQVNVDVDHPNTSELVILLHLPEALANAPGITSPLTLDLNGGVDDSNTYVPNPSNDSPDLIQLLGAQCSLATSTSPEDFVTENSGGAPNNIGGTWYIEVIDNDVLVDANGDLVNANGGEVTAASISLTCGFPFPYTAYDCSLQGVTLLNEWVAETNCDQSDWIGAQIKRTWQAVDKFGNTSVCTQTVNLIAPTFDDLITPGDVHLECDGSTPEDITPEVSGGLSFDCDAITDEHHGVCDITFTYEDQVLSTCGAGFKIIRTWTAVNCCTYTTKNYTQLIFVEDTTGPSIGQGDINVGTANYDCSANISLSDLGISDDCSGISSVNASYTSGGGVYQGSGTLVIVDLLNGGTLNDIPLGVTQVLITAKDGCLNVTEEMIDITVVDDTPPIAVCDDELNVSLGSTGEAWIRAEDVDEGSYDNCGDFTLEVRRVGGCLGTSEWDDTAPIACCDIGVEVIIELRVTDASGNSNVCWKNLTVEDALPPIIVCPEDKTFTCDDPALHDPLGEATTTDNCGSTVSFVDSGELDNCSAGSFIRTFTATDGSGKSTDVQCTQTITVEHVSDFVVQFPQDATLTDCALQDSGEPIILDDDCELVAISSDTLIFELVEDACYKLEITWTVINWCIYDPANPNNTAAGFPFPTPNTFQDDGDGFMQHVQTVKVLDDEAPVIDCPGDLVFCDASAAVTEGCAASINLSISASDACTLNPDDLNYSYKIDANNDGSFDIIDSGSDASGVYPYGTHSIKWIVEDGCGNSTECVHLFTVEDCKNPTPVCLNGLTIPTMNSNGCVEIWANDFLEYGFDNCSSADFVENSVKMRRAGTSDVPTDAITFCCDDLDNGIATFIDVEIWVWDEAGNSDFCTTYIGLQDNSNVCPDTDTGSSAGAMIAGHIETEGGNMVEAADVDLSGSSNFGFITGNTGTYSFPNLPMAGTYTVTPEKDINPLNGVSTFDLVLMSKHILGTDLLDSPYQLIAADVNNDANITTFDVVQTRQLILFIISDFPSNTSWRFVDMDYVFPNPANPWSQSFPEARTYNTLAQDQMNSDFIGIKTGDVSGDAIANSLLGSEERNAVGTLGLLVDDAELTAGQSHTVDFRASDFENILGYQFTLNFDIDALEFAGVEAGALTVSEANFGLSMLDEGVITTSFNANEAISVEDDAVLFSITFNTNSSADLNEVLTVGSRYTTAEAYTNDLEMMDITLQFNTSGTTVAANAFELYQNRPNPFSDATVISFNLPEASTATLRVYDVSGRTLRVVNGDFARGYNEVTINRADLDGAGVLYYQLDTPNNSATLKMILLK